MSSTERNTGRRPRSKAWFYYSVLAVLSLCAVFGGFPQGVAGFLIFGAYSVYLYRGGRFVLWIW